MPPRAPLWRARPAASRHPPTHLACRSSQPHQSITPNLTLQLEPSRQIPSPASCRSFSSTPPVGVRKKTTLIRRDFYNWLNNQGRNFRVPLPGQPNYLASYDRDGRHLLLGGGGGGKGGGRDGGEREDAADGGEQKVADADGGETDDKSAKSRQQRALRTARQPFPLNEVFRSEAVLSEEFREAIWHKVVVGKMSVRDVSAQMKVTMERVGAVVRLMEIQRQWQDEGKQLATRYARAVLKMVPVTEWNPKRPIPHESINDLPVHAATMQQIFHPVSESKHFTREDAAKVFDPDLLPADKRIPHPELVQKEKMRLEGWSRAETQKYWHERAAKEKATAAAKAKKHAEEQARTVVIEGARHDFRFKPIAVSSESTGENGRSHRGVGWRYGFPHEDRKRAQVRIPTRVD